MMLFQGKLNLFGVERVSTICTYTEQQSLFCCEGDSLSRVSRDIRHSIEAILRDCSLLFTKSHLGGPYRKRIEEVVGTMFEQPNGLPL